MNAATPVTATAIISSILLAGGARALTLAEVRALARSVAILIHRRKAELVGPADFRSDDALRATLEQMHATGIISYLDEGVERLYTIRAEQHHKAAYYRNTAIHHVLVDAVVEVALLMSGEKPAQEAATDPRDTFLSNAVRLRGVFKFEFYFARKPQFRDAVIANADERFNGWERNLDNGAEGVAGLMRPVRLLVAHGVLRSFIDAYVVAAANLLRHEHSAARDSGDFVAECIKLGRQYLLQAQISSPESVSKPLYQTAYKLIEHRGLADADSLPARREFADFLRRACAALDRSVAIMVHEAGELRVNTGHPK